MSILHMALLSILLTVTCMKKGAAAKVLEAEEGYHRGAQYGANDVADLLEHVHDAEDLVLG